MRIDIVTAATILLVVLLAACTLAETASTRTLSPGEPDIALPDPSTLPLPPVRDGGAVTEAR